MSKRVEKSFSKKMSEERRRKNVESAIRSRERLKNEQNWMSVQMKENDDRMKKLERQIEELTEELTVPQKSRSSKMKATSGHGDRPSWFGEPF